MAVYCEETGLNLRLHTGFFLGLKMVSKCFCIIADIRYIYNVQKDMLKCIKKGRAENASDMEDKRMSKIGIFMADGCEEIEGLTVVDIVRRAKMEIVMISITGKKEITGSHEIVFHADALAEEVSFDELDGIVLPGGMPGTLHLGENAIVNQTIHKFAAEGKLVCAICAAPSVLGAAGILKGKRATCHPGFEEKLTGAVISEDVVVMDENIITSRGMGTAIPFALAIVRYFMDDTAVEQLEKGLVYHVVQE